MPASKHRRKGKLRKSEPLPPCHPPASRPVYAIHEAGHAYGRFITADRMGIEPAEAVKEIVVHADPRTGRGREATTYGLMFSNEMNGLALELAGRHGTETDGIIRIENPFRYYQEVVVECRKANHNLQAWAEAKILQCVAGPYVEAAATGQDFAYVAAWEG